MSSGRMEPNTPTEAAAEALFCEIWEGSDAWELATDSQKATTRQWVAAVLAALNLTEEYGWQLGDFAPHRYATKVLAQERIDELDGLYGHGPESEKWSSLPRQLMQRLISPWVATPEEQRGADGDPMCSQCSMPEPAEWCWQQSVSCPFGKPPRSKP